MRNITTLNQFVALNAYFYVKDTELDIGSRLANEEYITSANVTLYELQGDGNGNWYAKQLAAKSV